MRINKLNIKGFRGINRSFEFGDLNIISGINGSGKTTILSAISLCLIGYIPGHGKTPRAIFQNASRKSKLIPRKIEIYMETDEGKFLYEASEGKRNVINTKREGQVSDKSLVSTLVDKDAFFQKSSNEIVRSLLQMMAKEDSIDCVGDELHGILMEKVDMEKELVLEFIKDWKGKESIQEAQKAVSKSIYAVQSYSRGIVAEYEESLKKYENLSETDIRSKGEIDRDMRDMDAVDANETRLQVTQESLSELEKLIAEKSLSLSDLKKSGIPDMEKAAERLASMEEHLQTETPKNNELKLNEGRIYQEIESIDKDILKIGKKIEAIRKNPKECVLCGNWGDGWSDNILGSYRKELATLEQLRKDKYLDKENNNIEISASNVLLKENKKALKLRKQKLSEYQERNKTIEDLKVDIKRHETSIEVGKKTLAEINEFLKDKPNLEERNGIKALLIDELSNLKMVKSIEKDLERSKERKEFLEGVSGEIKKMNQRLKVQQEKEVNKVLNEGLEIIRQVASPIIDGEIIVDKKEGIGCLRGHSFIPMDCFSGSEKEIIQQSILLYLAQNTETRILMIDEFGRISEGNQNRVKMSLTEKLMEGKIDQVFLTVPNNEELSVGGIQIKDEAK